MIRIALCDDEQMILDEVTQYLEHYAFIKKRQDFDITQFTSARSLKSALEDNVIFDIFVLDVYIGNEMGTALARSIRSNGIESPIIFLTTSLEHAPQGYEMGTLRYLIKPLNVQKFYEAIDAAILQAEKAVERLVKLKTENGVQRLNANLILYAEAHDHYQYVSLLNGGQIKLRMTVTELYATLVKYGGFIRVGSSYIINLRNIKKVTTSDVLLYNNIKIPIPRGKHAELKKAFWDYQCEAEEEDPL